MPNRRSAVDFNADRQFLYIGRDEAREHLGVNKRTLRLLIADGTIITRDHRYLPILWESVIAYLERDEAA